MRSEHERNSLPPMKIEHKRTLSLRTKSKRKWTSFLLMTTQRKLSLFSLLKSDRKRNGLPLMKSEPKQNSFLWWTVSVGEPHSFWWGLSVNEPHYLWWRMILTQTCSLYWRGTVNSFRSFGWVKKLMRNSFAVLKIERYKIWLTLMKSGVNKLRFFWWRVGVGETRWRASVRENRSLWLGLNKNEKVPSVVEWAYAKLTPSERDCIVHWARHCVDAGFWLKTKHGFFTLVFSLLLAMSTSYTLGKHHFEPRKM